MAFALTLAFVIWVFWANKAVEDNTYRITGEQIPTGFDSFRIAQISDLHNDEFCTENRRLLTALEKSNPDIIVITGDMIDSRSTDVQVALDFAEKAVNIAPCYYVTGNHEYRVPKEYAELKAGLEALGAEVLENRQLELERNGSRICLMGMNDPSLQTWSQGMDERLAMNDALTELIEDCSDVYTILLSHRPEMFDIYAEHEIDLVLTGHAHGGQARLPFVGGIVAPGQGFFPQYDSGLYVIAKTHMMVSRGIGNSLCPLRFNNRPEIVLVELCREIG